MQNPQKPTVRSCACEICQQRPYSKLAKEHQAINRILATLDEKHRRRFAGLLALQWGRGGIQRLSEITGLSRHTIQRGRNAVRRLEPATERGRVRHPGGGRQTVEKKTRRFSRSSMN